MNIKSEVTKSLLNQIEEVEHYQVENNYFVKLYLVNGSTKIHKFGNKDNSMRFFNFIHDNVPNIV